MAKLVNYPCALPTATVPQDIDALSVAEQFTKELDTLNSHHFLEDAIWRDVFALTGTFRTFHSASSVSAAWNETLKRAKVHSFILIPGSAKVVRLPQGSAWVEARFSFETDAVPSTLCSAIVLLVPNSDGEWRIWVLRTILEQLKGQPNVDVLQGVESPPKLSNGHVNGHGVQTHFDCVVIGGGLSGLSTGGRLKALGVSYVVLDKYKNVGDNWKLRYGSARCEFLGLGEFWFRLLTLIVHTNREYGE